MKISRYTTVEAIDQRLVWVNKEISIADDKARDPENPNATKAGSRAKHLRHEKNRLLARRNDLHQQNLL